MLLRWLGIAASAVVVIVTVVPELEYLSTTDGTNTDANSVEAEIPADNAGSQPPSRRSAELTRYDFTSGRVSVSSI